VLTAHPTEVQRQSILAAERRIAQLLAERDDILSAPSSTSSQGCTLTPRADAERGQLRACVAQLWQTRLLRHSKLADEIENALSYYEATFLREIPIYEQLEQELGGKLPTAFCAWASGLAATATATPM
jgi:phosphoenolpyruvate carboxylase